MDESATHSVPGPSSLKSLATKQKKKPIPTKEKPDKTAAPAGPPKEKKKTTLDLVCEAIEVSGDNRKGASVQAIKAYVKSKHGSEAANFNYLINKALGKGVETGTLERPPHSKDAIGAVGYFRLAKVEAPKRNSKVVKRQKTEEHVSDSEATEKPAKPRKRNLSDTYVEEMKGAFTSTPKPLKKQTTKAAKVTNKIPLKKKSNGKKDASDTEVVVKKKQTKSAKLPDSDTEGDLKQIKKPTKTTNEPLKKGKLEKPEAKEAEPPSKASKAKENKKLFSTVEEKENDLNNKRTAKSKKKV